MCSTAHYAHSAHSYPTMTNFFRRKRLSLPGTDTGSDAITSGTGTSTGTCAVVLWHRYCGTVVTVLWYCGTGVLQILWYRSGTAVVWQWYLAARNLAVWPDQAAVDLLVARPEEL